MQSFKSTMVCMSKSDNPLLSYLNDDLSVRLILTNLIELVILSGCVLHKHYLLTFRCFVPCSNCFFFSFQFCRYALFDGIYIMGNIFSYAMDGPRIEYYII
ncbi:hypothetical protein PVAP13_8KG359006 [Panicum virgatum]|uniref:Uncharacterized protein n=1 Tax=Panicum virgatum TaxID=38727 RepID=A0A8T0PZJ1_PANVG|nr:hypothetical protein PVAP13_8KG359006 [Panicum virgatum]